MDRGNVTRPEWSANTGWVRCRANSTLTVGTSLHLGAAVATNYNALAHPGLGAHLRDPDYLIATKVKLIQD